jgi:hypothetical protein
MKVLKQLGSISIIFIILHFSCENKNLKNKLNNNEIHENELLEIDPYYIDSLTLKKELKKVIYNKDKYQYNRIKCLYANRRKKDYINFLPYVKFMADNSDYYNAHGDVYHFYLAIYNNNDYFANDSLFLKFNKNDREIVLEHLDKGKKLDNWFCIKILKRLKEKGIYDYELKK